MNVIIIGSGIIGLCMAEFFSRQGSVCIVSDENPLAGSRPAPAHLGTKGQQFPRATYFSHKLAAKSQYPAFLAEIEAPASLFQQGIGCDFFETAEACDNHFKRVFEGDDQAIKQISKETICYENEALVDAQELLTHLKSILLKRKVSFKRKKIAKLEDVLSLETKDEKTLIIFCTGAWTKGLLTEMGFTLPPVFTKERLTFGLTTKVPCAELRDTDDVLLRDFIVGETKLTLSRIGEHYHLASQSLRVDSLNEPSFEELMKKRDLDLLLLPEPYQSHFRSHNKQSLFGYRVAYGKEELVVSPLTHEKEPEKRFFVCAGAHKSGYLFALAAPKILEAYL